MGNTFVFKLDFHSIILFTVVPFARMARQRENLMEVRIAQFSLNFIIRLLHQIHSNLMNWSTAIHQIALAHSERPSHIIAVFQDLRLHIYLAIIFLWSTKKFAFHTFRLARPISSAIVAFQRFSSHAIVFILL
jgi:hypothetical protein